MTVDVVKIDRSGGVLVINHSPASVPETTGNACDTDMAQLCGHTLTLQLEKRRSYS